MKCLSPCEYCGKPTDTENAGEVRVDTSGKIRVTCSPCHQLYNLWDDEDDPETPEPEEA